MKFFTIAALATLLVAVSAQEAGQIEVSEADIVARGEISERDHEELFPRSCSRAPQCYCNGIQGQFCGRGWMGNSYCAKGHVYECAAGSSRSCHYGVRKSCKSCGKLKC